MRDKVCIEEVPFSCQISQNRSAFVITAARKTIQLFFVCLLFFFNLLKIFLEKLYFLFENMCLMFGKDVIFVSAGDIFGLVLFWICFVGLGFF